MLQILPEVPSGWLKVERAAKLAGTSLSRAKALAIAGLIPVAIDDLGYMRISPDSLRNGAHHVLHNCRA